ncbi:hypothetical protein V6N12_039429 [Hibiscus sabdariffa]|uniref:Uncharacterized protein n=1 Tax=Hibiscus sabdariffa TaxID=183260 RepID=A0ABR2E176_9ROSI
MFKARHSIKTHENITLGVPGGGGWGMAWHGMQMSVQNGTASAGRDGSWTGPANPTPPIRFRVRHSDGLVCQIPVPAAFV